MKICLIVDDYLPDSIKVAAKMMHELAVEFNNQGYEVIVITPSDKIKENSNIFYLDNIKIIQFKTGK
ncbi:MAG: glycosyltransferase WbuB, partial [Leptospiraceae bacterium]|nr:glycosyltransferase WbuB [Leptospiraceae bacterium]